jgi:hypothetical protein
MIFWLGVALVLGGIAVAIALPRQCYEISGACDFHDLEGCGTICYGAGLLVRATIATGGLVLATAAWLVARGSYRVRNAR